jgi:lipoprotein-anchoring transpeptidase ErfK/SrfK
MNNDPHGFQGPHFGRRRVVALVGVAVFVLMLSDQTASATEPEAGESGTTSAVPAEYVVTGESSVQAPASEKPAAAQAPAVKLEAAVRENLAWQIALERGGFSPGLLDGKMGAKTRWAATQFQLAHKLPATGKFDAGTSEALGTLLPDPATVIDVHTISAGDCDAVTGVTKDWIERSKMKTLGYDTLTDELAERFQTSQAMIKTLNAGVDVDKLDAGARVNVPAIGLASHKAPVKPVASLEVNLTRKTVRALDADALPVALVNCSIAAHVEKRPSGDAAVTSVAFDPNYTFNPELYPEVKNVTTRLIIPPGPRNPVGIAWIGLSLPGYGIHGTPWPELIGKTGSHGCIRLANWDACRLAKLVRVGMPVHFVEE